jgi:hypothetical protein
MKKTALRAAKSSEDPLIIRGSNPDPAGKNCGIREGESLGICLIMK